jgi:predicted DsbA family dithiol-disulfide isomerase
MHDALFAFDGALDEQFVLSQIRDVGLDEARFRECFEGQATAAVDRDKTSGERLGIGVTPTFLLGSVESSGTVRVRRFVTGVKTVTEFTGIPDSALRGTS